MGFVSKLWSGGGTTVQIQRILRIKNSITGNPKLLI